jgi:hypothetical protein
MHSQKTVKLQHQFRRKFIGGPGADKFHRLKIVKKHPFPDALWLTGIPQKSG